jgi:hypothetical protein
VQEALDYFVEKPVLAATSRSVTFDAPMTGAEVVETGKNSVHTLRLNLGMRITPQTLLLAQFNQELGGSKDATVSRFFGLRFSHVFFPTPPPSGREPITDPASRAAPPH